MQGISYLHNQGIVHKNIKSSNIFLGKDLTPKLCDVRYTQIKEATASISSCKRKFETAFLAPELYLSNGVNYTLQSDIYALGIVFLEIASQKSPFKDVASISFWITTGGREEIPIETPKEFAEIIKDCWSENPTKRPSANEILLRLEKIMPNDALEKVEPSLKSFNASSNELNFEIDSKIQILKDFSGKIEPKQKTEINQSHYSFNVTNKISQKQKENFIKECEIMAKICNNVASPNILKLYGYSIDQKYLMLLELCPIGSLFKLLRIHKTLHFSWAMRIKIAIGTTKGISMLHKNGIIHKDIKSLNVLLDHNFIPKICDFGISQIENQTKAYWPSFTDLDINDSHEEKFKNYSDLIKNTNISENAKSNQFYPHPKTEDTNLLDQRPSGTIPFMAPELFSQKPVQYSIESDIYALGMLFWEIASRQWPFETIKKRDDLPCLIQQSKFQLIAPNFSQK